MRTVVLTIDQRGSTKDAATDRVPATLAALADIAERLLREDSWNIGIGIGEVDEPLPESTRAGRGPAYLHAREAVTTAKSAPWRLRVAGDDPRIRALETTLWLWAAVLNRRTSRGWEVADL